MRALIACEGGNGMGFGHITRCLSLYRALERTGVSPVMVIRGDRAVKKVLGRQRCEFFDWIREKGRFLSMASGSDIVVVDSYYASKRLCEEISRRAIKTLYIDDYKRMQYPAGIVINGTIGAEKFDYPKTHGVSYLLGAKYIPIRKEFCGAGVRKIRKSMRNILITFGGTDKEIFTAKLLKVLKERFPGLRYQIASGKKNFSGPDKLRKLMMLSDLCISAGGQTLYELASCGLPAVGISFAENQTFNLKGFRRSGFLKYAGRHTDLDIFRKVVGAIEALSGPDARRKASAAGMYLIDGMGSLRVAEYLLGSLPPEISVRKAINSDCARIWRWRNDSRTRRSSFEGRKIPYGEHKKWFTRIMTDGRARIYIGENGAGERVGQARLESMNDGSKAYIHVNLNPGFFGKGIGCRLIRAASETFCSERREVRSIFAEVISDNAASITAFLKAGYVFYGKSRVSGRGVTILRYAIGRK